MNSASHVHNHSISSSSSTNFSPLHLLIANNNSALTNLTFNNETFNTTAAAAAGADDDDVAGRRLRHSCTQLIVYMFPIQFIICIVGNILNLLVLTREKVSTSRQVYIISLSITDLLYFICQFEPYIEAHHIEIDYSKPHRDAFEHILWYTDGLWTWLQSAFSLSSDLILMAFSIERCMAITRPFSRMGGGSASQARRIVFFIVGFTVLHAWVECYRYYRTIVLVDRGVPAKDAYELKHAPNWLVSWANEYQLVHLIVLPIAVFVTLFVTTTLIIVALAKQRRYHRQTLDPKQFREANVSHQYTLMLVAAVVTYIVFCSWNFLFNVGDFLSRYVGVKNPLGNQDTIDNLVSCQAVATNWNYALNFILYSFVSSKFRHHLKMLSRHASRRWSDSLDTVEDWLTPADSPNNHAHHQRHHSRGSRWSGDSQRTTGSEWIQMNGGSGGGAGSNNHQSFLVSTPSQRPIMSDSIVSRSSSISTTNTAIVPLTMMTTAPSGGATVSMFSHNGRQHHHHARSFDDADDRVLFRSFSNSLKNNATPSSAPSRSKSPTISLQNVNNQQAAALNPANTSFNGDLPKETVVTAAAAGPNSNGIVGGNADGLRQRRVSLAPVVEQDQAELVQNEVLVDGATL